MYNKATQIGDMSLNLFQSNGVTLSNVATKGGPILDGTEQLVIDSETNKRAPALNVFVGDSKYGINTC